MRPRYNRAVPLPLAARLPHIIDELLRALNEPGQSLAPAALAVARVEYPSLDPAPYLRRLDELALGVGECAARDGRRTLERLRRMLFDQEGFRGNTDQYFDPRNSCLNQVLEDRRGIPITLSVLTMEVGRRVGLRVHGLGLLSTSDADV